MSGDYENDIKINENDLENEWIEQPSLFLYYAEAHAEALHKKDLSKSKLEYRYAKLYSEIRNKWQDYFDGKPTEAAIKERVLVDSVYKKAEKVYIDACYQANLMLSAKTAFDHRKRALENLVSLKISGFHSAPKNKMTRSNNVVREKGGHKAQKQTLNVKGSRAKSRLNRKK